MLPEYWQSFETYYISYHKISTSTLWNNSNWQLSQLFRCTTHQIITFDKLIIIFMLANAKKNFKSLLMLLEIIQSRMEIAVHLRNRRFNVRKRFELLGFRNILQNPVIFAMWWEGKVWVTKIHIRHRSEPNYFCIIYSQWTNAKRAQMLKNTNRMKLIRIFSTRHTVYEFCICWGAPLFELTPST